MGFFEVPHKTVLETRLQEYDANPNEESLWSEVKNGKASSAVKPKMEYP